jgi:hypothetical protein
MSAANQGSWEGLVVVKETPSKYSGMQQEFDFNLVQYGNLVFLPKT